MGSVCVYWFVKVFLNAHQHIKPRVLTYQPSHVHSVFLKSRLFSNWKITENVNVNWLISSLQRTTQKRVFITVQHKKLSCKNKIKMDVSTFKISQILFSLQILLFQMISESFNPEIQMPYRKISGSSTTEINKIGLTLTCNEQRNSLKNCATECLNGNLNTGCPGFFGDSTHNNVCFLCKVSNITEVQGSSHSVFGTNDVVYLLKSKPVKPEVSMNFDSHSGNTIPGTGTEGTTTNVVEDDFVSGIKGTGLYLHDGGKVALTGSSTQCWTNLENCTSSMTVSIWFKLRSEPEWNAHIMASAANIQEGFTCYLQGKKPSMAGYVTAGRYYAVGHTAVVVDEWSLITGTFHYDHGITISVNGVLTQLILVLKMWWMNLTGGDILGWRILLHTLGTM